MLHIFLQKSFQCELPHMYLATGSAMRYITFPDKDYDEILICKFSAGYFCRLNTTLHPVDPTQDCNFYLFKNTKKSIWKFCSISLLKQEIDNAINLDQNVWAIMT